MTSGGGGSTAAGSSAACSTTCSDVCGNQASAPRSSTEGQARAAHVTGVAMIATAIVKSLERRNFFITVRIAALRPR